MLRIILFTCILFLGLPRLTPAGPFDGKKKFESKPLSLHSIIVRIEEVYDPYKDPKLDIDLLFARSKLPDPYVIVKYREFLEDGELSANPLFLGRTSTQESKDLARFDETIAYYGHDARRPTTNGVVDLEVWDRDGLGLRDDFIGYYRIDLRKPSEYLTSGFAKYRTPLLGAGYDTKQYGIGFITFEFLAKAVQLDANSL